MDNPNLKNLKPRIGLIISPSGFESITLIGEGSEETTAANHFCFALEQELKMFESAIKRKFNDFYKLERTATQ